jgi:hypothetical protein
MPNDNGTKRPLNTSLRPAIGAGFGFAQPQGGAVAPARGPGRAPVGSGRQAPGRDAGAQATMRAMAGMNPAQLLSRCFAQMAARVAARRDRVADADALRASGHGARRAEPGYVDEVRQRTANLPAVLSRAIHDPRNRERGVQPFDPDWHQVRNLPGYLQQAIRVLGRDAFAGFTPVPIEDIQVVAWLDPRLAGGTPNPKSDLDQLSGWIRRNGAKDDEAVMNMGDYSVETQLWRTAEHEFLVVRDAIAGQQVGCYVYGWAGGRGVHLDDTGPRPALARRAPGEDEEAPRGPRF